MYVTSNYTYLNLKEIITTSLKSPIEIYQTWFKWLFYCYLTISHSKNKIDIYKKYLLLPRLLPTPISVLLFLFIYLLLVLIQQYSKEAQMDSMCNARWLMTHNYYAQCDDDEKIQFTILKPS